MVRSVGVSMLVVLLSSGAALAQPNKPPGIPKPPEVPAKPVVLKPATVTVELSGKVKLRPQASDRALGASGTTNLLDDETLQTSVVVRFATQAARDSFRTDYPTLVLQRREGASGAWTDFHTFYSPKLKAKAPVIPGAQPAPAPEPITQVRPELPQPVAGASPTAPEIPGKPGQKPGPKVGIPTDAPGTKTVVPGMAFEAPGMRLVSGTSALRASARRMDGSSIDSPSLPLRVRKAPPILTLMAQGGACADADGTLDSSGTVKRNDEGCAEKGLNGVFLGALTPKANVNCNDHCDKDCTNFFEHLAGKLMDEEGLADRLDFIDNPGEALCQSRDNPDGIDNRIVVGKWRNSEEEGVCGTDLQFEDMIDDFEEQGGKSLILIGQSLGGAKLTQMQRDNWRWGSTPTLELFVLWDATSLLEDSAVMLNNHPSFGVRTVGNRAKRVLSFFQYDDIAAFQNGAPLTDRSDAEQHDYNQCLTHNGIARGQFIHRRTKEAVRAAVVAARDRVRE